MKISWRWLEKYIDLNGVDPVETGHQFTVSVAELDDIIELGKGLENHVAVKITALEPHPDSEKLKLATVDTGNGLKTVVCGASNTRVGMVAVLASKGSLALDSKGEWFEVGDAVIRGVASSGMLVSSYEMGLGDDHSGIMELLQEVKSGTLLKDICPLIDVVWDIDNKSLTHRPDLWGHMGIAREVASLLGRDLSIDIKSPEFTSDTPLAVVNEDPEFCPRYTAYKISDVTIEPSPLWMQVLLYHTDQRPINNIVDFTNFTMLATGNPLHAFDERDIQENTIIVRRANNEEKITTLDGETHTLCEDDLVIADNKRPVALAGIMGGQNSEVRNDTSSIILESANFYPGKIRKSAVRLGIRTESSSRFEKSLDPENARIAAFLFADLVNKNIAGSKISSKYYDEGNYSKEKTIINITMDFIRLRLGVQVPDEKIIAILRSLDFTVAVTGDNLEIEVPSYRATKDISIPEDIVEEVGRIYGFGNIVPTAPRVVLEKPWSLPSKSIERKIRDTLSFEAGFNQVMTYSFDKSALLEKSGFPFDSALELRNPISKEEPVLRQTMVLNLLEKIVENERQESDIRLYEQGRVFLKNPVKNEIALQPRKLTMVVANTDKKMKDTGDLFFGLKHILENLAFRLEKGEFSLENIDSESLKFPWVHPVRSGVIKFSGVEIGYMSMIHPKVQKSLGIKSTVAISELDIDRITALETKVKLFKPLAKFPGIRHDISVIVDKSVKAHEISDVLQSVDSNLIQDIKCVDVYEGEKFPGKRSLSFRMLFLHPDRTLTQQEVSLIHEKAVDAVTSKLGAVILS